MHAAAASTPAHASTNAVGSDPTAQSRCTYTWFFSKKVKSRPFFALSPFNFPLLSLSAFLINTHFPASLFLSNLFSFVHTPSLHILRRDCAVSLLKPNRFPHSCPLKKRDERPPFHLLSEDSGSRKNCRSYSTCIIGRPPTLE